MQDILYMYICIHICILYTRTHARARITYVNCNVFFWSSVIRVMKLDCGNEIRIFLVNLPRNYLHSYVINYSFFRIWTYSAYQQLVYWKCLTQSMESNVKRKSSGRNKSMQVVSILLLLFAFGLNRFCYLINYL